MSLPDINALILLIHSSASTRNEND